ncbi:MAG: hypothetical protein AABY22_03470 [Nanoarchaeota archaeon]
MNAKMETEEEKPKKSWSELTDSEKIERLREFAQKVDGLKKRLDDFQDKFEGHKHINNNLVNDTYFDLLDDNGNPYEDEEKPTCEECEKRKYI